MTIKCFFTSVYVLVFCNLTATLRAQNLFHTIADTFCVSYSPIHGQGTVNNALTYNWNFGNGQTSTVKSPVFSYTTAGAYTLSLDITTAATDRMMTKITVNAIPNTWNDGLGTDPMPDLYLIMKDQNGAIIYNSPAVFDKFPPVTFNHGILMKPNSAYTLEVWEYDFFGQDDFLAYIAINTNTETATLSNGGVSIQYASVTGKTAFSYAKKVLVLAQPTVNLSLSNGNLVAQATGGVTVNGSVTYSWRLNNVGVATTTTSTYRPTQTGIYSVMISSGYGCSATSNSVTVTTVAVADLDPEKRWTLSPNPVNIGQPLEIVAISDKNQEVKAILMDVSGKILSIQTERLQNGENHLALTPPQYKGLFFVKIEAKDVGQKTFRFVVQ